MNILPSYDSAGRALLDTCFQVATIVSTTGFATTDFALWPTLSQFVLILLMFLGGCAGNSQGVSRLVEGMRAEDAIAKLAGIRCGFKATSCPDQLSKALRIALAEEAKRQGA